MPSNIDMNTENMILSFLKYGTKDALSVDEFLRFRQQAVHESELGLKGTYAMHGMEQEGMVQTAEETLPVKEIHLAERLVEESIPPKPKDVPKKKKKKDTDASGISVALSPPMETGTEENEREAEEEKEEGFTEDEFLRMMREVED